MMGQSSSTPLVGEGSSPARGVAPGSPWRNLLLTGLVLAATLPHLTALRGEFAFDDRGLISKNPRVWDSSPLPILSTPYWPEQEDTGLYRPVTGFSYWVDGKIWGNEPLGFHVTNVVLHVIVVLVLFRVLSGLFPFLHVAAGVACLLFAVHPLHSEAVFAISGRAELFAALFGLIAYALARRYANTARVEVLIASALSFGLAALSKESAIGLGLLLLFHAIVSRRSQPSTPGVDRNSPASDRMATSPRSGSRWWIAASAWGAVLLVVLLLRVRVLGSVVGLGEVSRVDNPLVHGPFLERLVTALGIQGWVLGKLLVPIHLSADYSFAQIVPNRLWLAIGAAMAIGAAAATIYLWKRRDEPVRWGAVLLLASGLLTANLVFPIGTVFGERLTYLPSAAVLWVIAVVGTRGFSGPLRVAGTVLLVLYLLALGVRTGLRGIDWEDNLSLFRSASISSPRSVKVWTNLAFSLADAKQLEPALEAARNAEGIDPNYAGAHLALGSVLNQLGRPREALPYLQRADDLPGQRGFDATLELGNAYLLLGDGARAESVFVAARGTHRLDPEERSLIGLASAQALQSRWSDSSVSWRQAAIRRPTDAQVRQRFAYALWQDGAIDSAEVAYREALGLRPDDASLRNDLAWFLIQTRKDSGEALRLAEAAFADSPTANVADTVLEARLAAVGCEDAMRWVDSLRARGDAELLSALSEKLAARCGSDSTADSSSVD